MLPGPAQFKLLKSFVPSLATYGVCAGTVVVYMASEWKGKDLLQFVPIYNRYESVINFWMKGLQLGIAFTNTKATKSS